MKLYAVIAIMLVFSLPLVRAQGQPTVPVDQPVVPEDVATALVGVGAGPAVSLIIGVIMGVLGAPLALALSFCYGDALWNCLESWITWILTCFGVCPWDFWCQCLPCVSVIPHTLRAARSTCNLVGL